MRFDQHIQPATTRRIHDHNRTAVARRTPVAKPTLLAWACAAALAWPLSSTTAHAQQAADTSTPGGASVALSLPAQPLAQALGSLSRQFGTAIGGQAALLEGKTAPAVQATLTLPQALDRILAGSGLSYVRSGERAYTVIAASSVKETTLGAVTVTGEAINDGTTEGTGSYTQAGPSPIATGLGLSLRETPQSVTVMTRQRMDDFQLNTLKDVLEQTPGITVYTEGDSIRFQARGANIENFQTDGDRGRGTQSTGTSYNHNLALDDLVEMDRVEIIKGSSGLLQGDGYPTATINLIRKKPTKEFQAHVSSGIGSWNLKKGEIDVSGPLVEEGYVRGRFVAGYRDSESYRDYLKNSNLTLYGTVDVDVAPDAVLNFGIDYKKHKNRGESGYVGVMAYDSEGNLSPLRSRSFNSAAPWSGYEQETIDTFASLDKRFDNGWEGRLRVSHENSRTPHWESGNIGGPYYSLLTRQTGLKDLTSNVSGSIKGGFEGLGRRHDFVAGFDFSKNSYATNSWWPTDYAFYDNYAGEFYGGTATGSFPQPVGDEWSMAEIYKTKSIRRGIYATGRINVSDDAKFIVGSRFSDYVYDYSARSVYLGQNSLDASRINEKNVFTPYAGLIYDISRNVSAYGSYASVFQPVTVQDEQGHTLDPQRGVTYELGLKGEFFNKKLNASAAFFWKRWKNSYERSGGLTPAGKDAYRNVDGAMEHGYEFEISGQLAKGLDAQGSFVMNGSSLTDLTRAPKYQMKVGAVYRPMGIVDKLTVGASARWQSRTYSQFYGHLEQKPYWVADMMLAYSFTKNLSASLNVNNVFDRKYFSGVTFWSYMGEYYTWGAPRSASLNIRYEF